MKKTILLIVLGILTVFCICYGTAKHMGGINPFSRSSWIEDDSEDEMVNGKYAIDQKLAGFSELRIDARVMSITIEEGPEFSVEGSYNKTYLKPFIELKNNVLEIKQAEQKKSKINTGSQTCRLVITVPSNAKLDRIKIDSNVGDIKVRELTAREIDIDTNVGQIDVRKVDFEECKCNSNVGEVEINPVKSIDEYNMSLSTDVGQVNVGGNSFKRSYNSRISGNMKIKVDTNVGEIKVK